MREMSKEEAGATGSNPAAPASFSGVVSGPSGADTEHVQCDLTACSPKPGCEHPAAGERIEVFCAGKWAPAFIWQRTGSQFAARLDDGHYETLWFEDEGATWRCPKPRAALVEGRIVCLVCGGMFATGASDDELLAQGWRRQGVAWACPLCATELRSEGPAFPPAGPGLLHLTCVVCGERVTVEGEDRGDARARAYQLGWTVEEGDDRRWYCSRCCDDDGPAPDFDDPTLVAFSGIFEPRKTAGLARTLEAYSRRWEKIERQTLDESERLAHLRYLADGALVEVLLTCAGVR